MAEYIDREELLKRLYNKLVSTAGYVRREIRGKDIDIVKECPAANVVPAHWVSVKHDLPEKEAKVLAACERNGFRFVCPLIYENGTVLTQDSCWNWHELDGYGTFSEENDDYFIPKGWWENRQFTPDDVYNNPADCIVTHWMPLPKPPKMDGGANE